MLNKKYGQDLTAVYNYLHKLYSALSKTFFLSFLTQCDVYFLRTGVVSGQAFGEESQTLGLKQESISFRRQRECALSLKAATKSAVHSVISQNESVINQTESVISLTKLMISQTESVKPNE